MLKRKIGQRWTTAILSFCVLICISIVLCSGLFGLQDSDVAFAFNNNNMTDSTTVSVNELLLDNYDTSVSGKKVFGENFWQLIDCLRDEGEESAEIADLSDKDANAIRTANGGKDIVVEIDGKKWTVTDLRKLDNGQVIATMWLATSAETSKWNLWYANTPTDAYPGNMYSSSYIRANALNSGGCGYVETKGATTLTQIAQRADHQYAKFTMQSVKDGSRELSLLDYIVQPKDVAYQGTETAVKYNSYYKTCPNEAWGTPEIEDYYNTNFNYSSKPNYTEWASDYLWLPSIAETGYSGVTGIWNLSDAQRSNRTNSWLRSGYCEHANSAYCLSTSGSATYVLSNSIHAVRPAFHLDLTAAEQVVDKGVEYIANPAFDITQKDYNATAQTFTLQDFDTTKIKITSVTGKDNAGNTIADGITFAENNAAIAARNAGTYTVTLDLLDKDNTAWADKTTDAKTVTFTISRRRLNVTWNPSGDTAWSWAVGASGSISVADDRVSGDDVAVALSYKAESSSTQVSVSGSSLDVSTLAQGRYTIYAKIGTSGKDRGNYYIDGAQVSQAFEIKAKTVTFTGVTWMVAHNGAPSNATVSGSTPTDLTASDQYGYDSDAYIWTIDDSALASQGVRIYTGYGNGFVNGYHTQRGTDAGTYVTKVCITALEGYDFAPTEYAITWTIEQATYDLTQYGWNDANITYDGSAHTVTLQLPSTLSVPSDGYQGNVGTDAGTYYASVTRLVNSDKNYKTPQASDFPASWTNHAWTIGKKQIQIVWHETQQDAGEGHYYMLPSLSVADDVAKLFDPYRYYRKEDFDTETGVGTNPIGLEDIRYVEGTQAHYYVVVELRSNMQNNYEIDGDKFYPFVVGVNKTPVQLTLKGSGLPYDGTPHAATFDIQGASLAETDFKIVYRDAQGNESEDAPIHAGTYTVRVSIKPMYAEDYYLSDSSEFEFVIAKAQLDLNALYWEYTQPFAYTLDANGAVLHTVRLGGTEILPQSMREILDASYTDNSKSTVGSYRATVKLDFSTSAEYADYDITLPSGVSADTKVWTLSWQIGTRTIELPTNNNAWTQYDGQEHDLIAQCGMESGWEYYLDVAIVYNGESFAGQVGKDAGTYVVTFTIQDGVNTDPNNPNVEWSDYDTEGGKSVTIEIAQDVMTVTGWRGKGKNARVETDAPSAYYGYRYVDPNGNIVTDDQIAGAAGETFYKEVYILPEYEQNVRIEAADGVALKVAFISGQDGVLLQIPTLSDPTYTGSAIDIATLLQNYNADFMQLTGDVSGTNAGTYTLTVTPRDGAEWENPPQGVDPDGSIAIEWHILPAQLRGEWETADGKPTLKLPTEYDGKVEIEYEYRDAAGNVVAEDALQAGQTYSVVAKLKGDSAGNYVFIADDGQVTETPTQSAPYEFDFATDGNNGNGGIGMNEKWFQIAIWIMTVTMVLILLVLIMIWTVQLSIRNLHRQRDRRERK